MLCGSHIKIWNLANHMKKQNKNIKMLDLMIKNWKLRVWCSLFHFFHEICKISNFNMLPKSIWCKLLVMSWLYLTNVILCIYSGKSCEVSDLLLKGLSNYKVPRLLAWDLSKIQSTMAIWIAIKTNSKYQGNLIYRFIAIFKKECCCIIEVPLCDFIHVSVSSLSK